MRVMSYIVVHLARHVAAGYDIATILLRRVGEMWDSKLGVFLRWIGLLPVGLAILLGAEMLIDSALWIVLSSGWLVIAVLLFVGVPGLFLLTGWIAGGVATVCTLLAPNVRVGVILVGLAYFVVQALGLYVLYVAGSFVYLFVKVVFSAIVIYVLAEASRR